MQAFGSRGEIRQREGAGVCPCGQPAASGQIWATEWYDRIGLVERFVIVTLCPAHKARRPGEE